MTLPLSRRSLSLEALLAVVPELPEFEPLRQALLRVSVPNADRNWSSGEAYSTMDRRSVPVAALPQILSEAEAVGRRRTRRLYEGIAIGLSGVIDGHIEEKFDLLVAAGAEDEAAERWREAVAHYTIAARLGNLTEDLERRALGHRRLGRAWLNCGEFRNAAAEYGTGLAVAIAAGDLNGEITAATGLGNVASLQARWLDADGWYRHALDRCQTDFERERGQLCVNLSMASRERGRLDEARQWLERSRLDWSHLTESDHCGWSNNEGLLHLAAGELQLAEQSLARALSQATSLFDRAMILDNLADVAARQDRLALAESRAREAEQHALTLGSPRVLAEIYLRLGQIARRRNDPNGVVFFEKGLELSRDRGFPLLYGTILREYGLFRRAMSDARSARALFADALGVFAELGAAEHIEAVRREIEALV